MLAHIGHRRLCWLMCAIGDCAGSCGQQKTVLAHVGHRRLCWLMWAIGDYAGSCGP